MEMIVSDFNEQLQAIREVRTAVFLVEQSIPPELEYDEHDLTCRHAVAYCQQTPVATGRLDIHQDGKVGRVAVLKAFRRQGFGSQIMHALETEALKLGLKRIWFHSQVSAIPFYRSLGYQVIGEEFQEAGIPHRKMEKIW